MAYEPLHHKYRPQTFSDLVGQETIALTLSNALEQAKIAPAYLFTGPRGTGKTSSARILAKSLNCLNSDRPTPDPCGKCEVCLAIAKGAALDVMEIDAASNTGVDNIREIIERSRFAPVQCRYKVYCIDECHMLSVAAFNALLKTLEEPPPQVVFVLATTDPQRVLTTIISRCQRFDYRRIPLTAMTSHLRYIADAEKIAIADDALTLVAQIANGGLRDAESLLDQLSLLPEKITVEKVWDLVGAVPEQDLLKLLQAINGNDSLAVLQQCRNLLDRGREPLVVLQNLAGFYLNLLIAKTAPNHAELTAVTETCWQQLCAEANNWQTTLILRGQQHLQDAENQLKRTTQPRLWLEVTLLGLLPEAQETVVQGKAIAIPAPNPVPNPVVPPVPPAIPKEIAPPPIIPIEEKIEQDHAVEPTTPQTLPAPPTEHHLVQPQPVVSFADHAPPNQHQPTVEANPPAVAPGNDQDPIVNQQIWSKVVSCLQPPTTQALLKQQCHLVNFDGMSAIVGVSSANLQKMTQQKIPNIEAAFAQVCQRKVRVQLEVVSSPGKIAPNSTAPVNPINQAVAPAPPSAPEQPPSPPPPSSSTVPATAIAEIKPPNHPNLASAVKAPPARSFSHNLHNSNGNSNGSDYPPSLHPNEDILKDRPAMIGSAMPSAIATQNTPVLIDQPVTIDFPLENNPNNLAASTVLPLIADEIDVTEKYADSELQKAIASLTQSFEGEVLQLDNLDSLNSQDSLASIDDLDLDDAPFAEEEEEEEEEEKNLIPPEILNYSDRPDAEDYHDEW
jgi:DNA polymerase III subunit gamma/tau